MLIIDNQTDTKIDTKIIHKMCEDLTDKDVELIFVDDENIKEINAAYRGKNTPTDVLSFPLKDIPHAPLGTIIISVDTAKRAAKKFQHTLEDEISLLFIHGFLHVKGFDHEKDDGQMRKKEQELIERFSLPKSLIVRTIG